MSIVCCSKCGNMIDTDFVVDSPLDINGNQVCEHCVFETFTKLTNLEKRIVEFLGKDSDKLADEFVISENKVDFLLSNFTRFMLTTSSDREARSLISTLMNI